MILFDRETKTFNLNLDNSFYALQIDNDNHLIHAGWGPRPSDSVKDQVIGSNLTYPNYRSPLSFVTQFRPDEVLTFGDITTYQETLKVTFPTLPQPLSSGEASHLPIRDLRLKYTNHEIVNDGQPGLSPLHGLSIRNTSPRETLRVRLDDPVQRFTVTICYRLTPEYDIIERWLELENLGEDTIAIETCNFASLHLPSGTKELTSVSGAWAREFQPQREQLPKGTRILESRALQTGHMSNPFFLINRPGQAWENAGTVYFGLLAYSGSWRISFEQLPSWQIRVHAGYNPFDFRLNLSPGERHITPALMCGVCAEGWGGASRRMHAFIRERTLPYNPQSSRFRPVLYNSWEATNFNVTHANQVDLAQKAAAIGVELFCLDDGWFGARSFETAGLGDWFVRQEAFPDGLEALVKEVHRLGMKFGLWVEPEMVNSDSDLYRRHPDWVLHFPGRPRTEARHQLILDFGRKEVVEYIFNVLDRLVTRYQVAFLKWDMNRYTSEPGSVVGKEIWYRHVASIYDIMDRLRQKHSQLEIQSCSGGGGRVDLGILGRTDQVWVSDNTSAFERLKIQEGFSLAYPARVMEAWVTNAYNELANRSASLAMRFDVAMRGTLGIGIDLTKLSEEELETFARYIAFYKRIRHVVQEGTLYRLQRLEECGSSTILYVLPNGCAAVYSEIIADHAIGSFPSAIPLQGLHAEKTYAVFDQSDEELFQVSGYRLMTLGIPREKREHPGFSKTLYLKQMN